MEVLSSNTGSVNHTLTPNEINISGEADFFRLQRGISTNFNIVDEILHRSQSVRKDKCALSSSSGDINWGQLQKYIYQYQSVLAKLDIQPGDRVAIVAFDSSEMAVVVLSLMFRGCVVVMINPMVDTAGIVMQVSASKATTIITDDEYETSAFDGEIRRISLSTVSSLYDTLDLSAVDYRFKCNTTPFTPCFGVFTSGSTGTPKLAIHYHQDILVALTRYADQVLDIRRNDVVFCASRLSFAFGLQNMFLALLNSASYIFPPREIDTHSLRSVIEKGGTSIMFAVPRVYDMVLSGANDTGQRLSTLRLCISAGEPLSESTFKTWKAAFGLDIVDSLGSTEVFSTYISNFPGSSKIGATGKLIPGFQAKLLNSEGNPCRVDEAGVLWIRGASVITHYDGKAPDPELFQDGWFCTNDVFRQDIDNNYYFVGRNNDMIKINGLWVSPLEIEQTLLSMSEIAQAAVVSLTRADGSRSIKACIVLSEGKKAPTLSEIKDYCKASLAPWKHPHFVEYAKDLPKTATGKLARHTLRREVVSNSAL
ncbi:acetyl-CoA synthetase [Rhodobacteraceae bacterium KLH11]|nr:acetyl-CoA synthetase [Rhodobacteraceae bacterium KLH11]